VVSDRSPLAAGAPAPCDRRARPTIPDQEPDSTPDQSEGAEEEEDSPEELAVVDLTQPGQIDRHAASVSGRIPSPASPPEYRARSKTARYGGPGTAVRSCSVAGLAARGAELLAGWLWRYLEPAEGTKGERALQGGKLASTSSTEARSSRSRLLFRLMKATVLLGHGRLLLARPLVKERAQ